MIAYNIATTGHVFHPAYEYLYQLEARGYPHLNYNPEWSIEDIRYIPQNLALMLFGFPPILPECAPASPCAASSTWTVPFVVPSDVGMSLLLTSPAYLLAIPALRGFGRTRLVTGAVLAIALIALLNLMHFSQGWVQFGYRFSNDFAPFALLLVALGIARSAGSGWVVALLIGALDRREPVGRDLGQRPRMVTAPPRHRGDRRGERDPARVRAGRPRPRSAGPHRRVAVARS